MIKNTALKKWITIFILVLFLSITIKPIQATQHSINTTTPSSNTMGSIDDSVNKDNDSVDGEDGFLKRFEGYFLFAPEYRKESYLVDHNGREVKVWRHNYWQVMGTYLMENGNLIRTSNRIPNTNFPFGGFTGRVEMYDWNENMIWEFEYSNQTVLLHHDIEVLPNGNILMIAWENKNSQEAIEAGVNPDLISSNKICPDHIIEVKPTYPSGGTIVWEWHMWDHLIQEYDESKNNYGDISEHPELININHVNYSDIAHINSIDYNEEYDQILLSVRHYNEIWVIDHSTTTEEAAGHSGGRYGKGGDLLYRWGNSQTYDMGTSQDQQLFFQHDARWVEEGRPGEGNILVFNNGNGRTEELYSSVVEITPPRNEQGRFIRENSTVFGPQSPVWIFQTENKTDFYAKHLSGAQRLPNGNTLICHGEDGYFIEVNSENEIVWSYENTITASDVNPISDDCFTVQYYPVDYAGIGEYTYLDPEKPMKPDGETNIQTGTKYDFTTSTTDPNEDNIIYQFDWGDGTKSGWIGPYQSDEQVTASHSYRDSGVYQIRVKAKDINNFEGGWSDSLEVSVESSQVWMFGKIDSLTVRDSEISFWADWLIIFSTNPYVYEAYPLGNHNVVDDEYRGLLTKNIIFGKFYRKE